MRRLKRLREATTPDAADRIAEGKRLFLAANGNMSRVVEALATHRDLFLTPIGPIQGFNVQGSLTPRGHIGL